MKKDKKKGASKKTWVVDCRTDSAFDFALKVLKEADNDNYPRELRANFALIAYKNSCEAIARAQTDPHNYKLRSAFKLFIRNLKDIYKTCDVLHDIVFTSNNNQINPHDYHMIENPFDYIDINYKNIERDLGVLTIHHATQSEPSLVLDKMYKENCNRNYSMLKENKFDIEKYYKRFNYPRIYEKCVITKTESETIAKITPTNDIVVYLPKNVIDVFSNTKVDKYYSEGKNGKSHQFISLITKESSECSPIPSSLLINVPKDSFSNISELISAAAKSPTNVKEIYITAYRLGDNSSIINDIIEASKNKIKCKLYLEISARGEISQDIIYLEKLIKEADHNYLDIKVRYNGIKVHAKMIYIGLKDNPSIGIFSTGNYNASSALIYKDYHYISCEKNVTDMIKRNFSVLWNSEQPVLSSISNIITNEIYTEISKGKSGRVWMQTNHLDNKLIVSLLKEAMRRECDVKLIVRTTRGFHNRELKNCKTIVGKYLEHARVYIFGSGKDKRVYLSSSDILFRNLYNRFESYIKITNEKIEKQIVDDFRNLYKNGQ